MSSILIVDPDQILLDLLQGFCTEKGYTARTARSGQEALQILSEHPPDLVLSEVELPDVDGFTLVRRMYPVPVVLMSRDAAGCMRAEALRQGAEAFFAKPLSLMMLNVQLARLPPPRP